MVSEMAAVRSITYPKDLVTGITGFFGTGSFVDVTIVCGGFQLHAHRVVLAACSTYFEELFRSFPADRSRLVIALHNVDWEAFRLCVDFVYKGDTEVPADKLDTFLEVARALEIRDLRASGTVPAESLQQQPPIPPPAPAHPAARAPPPTGIVKPEPKGFEERMEASSDMEPGFGQAPPARDAATSSSGPTGARTFSRNGLPNHVDPQPSQPMRPPDFPTSCPATINPEGPFVRQNDWIWMGHLQQGGGPAYFCTGCAAMSIARNVMLNHSELHMSKS